jgi:hypothetical protein
MTRDQALELGAADPHHDAAIWQGTPEHQDQMRKEREEARALIGANGAGMPTGERGLPRGV